MIVDLFVVSTHGAISFHETKFTDNSQHQPEAEIFDMIYKIIVRALTIFLPRLCSVDSTRIHKMIGRGGKLKPKRNEYCDLTLVIKSEYFLKNHCTM